MLQLGGLRSSGKVPVLFGVRGLAGRLFSAHIGRGVPIKEYRGKFGGIGIFVFGVV